MKVIILAAGLGTRLQPIIGNAIPKVMVPVGGKPLLLHTLEHLKNQGFSDFCLNLHYLPRVITDYFGDGSKFGVSIHYSYEPELLESAGAIKKMEEWLGGDEFVLVYGDAFFNLDLRQLVELRRKHNAVGVGVVKETIHVRESDIVEVDPATNRVVAIHTRPHQLTELRPGLWATVGLYAWSREVLDYIPAGTKMHVERELLPILLREGKALYARPLEQGDVVVDVGKPDNYKKVQAMFAL